MGIKVKVGFTKDLFDKDGKLILPGPVFKLLDEIPDVKCPSSS